MKTTYGQTGLPFSWISQPKKAFCWLNYAFQFGSENGEVADEINNPVHTYLLQCYECNTMDNEEGCSDTAPGELTRCGPGDKGCFISRGGGYLDKHYSKTFFKKIEIISHQQQLTARTWPMREAALRSLTRVFTSARLWQTTMEVRHWCWCWWWLLI